MEDLERLKKILSYRRGHDSVGERAFFFNHLASYDPIQFLDAVTRAPIAYVIKRQFPDGTAPPILWSCHIDTVHAPTNRVFQTAEYDEGLNLFFKKDNEALGADDGAGMWLFLNMIDKNVPGTYIFHRGEERGGIGSKVMAADHKDWLSQFKFAIAFDRRGTGDVITEQFAGRCCSDTFAKAFAALLNGDNLFDYNPDPTGSFTDTSNYRRIIPECANVSVGYEDEHSGRESLDGDHLGKLRDRMIEVFSKPVLLPADRDKDEVDPPWEWAGYGGWGGETSYTKDLGKGSVHYFGKRSKKQRRKEKRLRKQQQAAVAGGTLIKVTPDWNNPDEVPSCADDVNRLDYKTLREFVLGGHVTDVTELLVDLAREVDDLRFENAELCQERIELEEEVERLAIICEELTTDVPLAPLNPAEEGVDYIDEDAVDDDDEEGRRILAEYAATAREEMEADEKERNELYAMAGRQ